MESKKVGTPRVIYIHELVNILSMVSDSDIRQDLHMMTASAVIFNAVVRFGSIPFSSIRDNDKSIDLAIYKPLNYINIL